MLAQIDRVEDTRQPPDDGAWAMEEANAAWCRGDLAGEFDDAIGAENLLVQELHGRINAESPSAVVRWAALRGFIREHFPDTYNDARNRVIEQHADALIADQSGR